MLVVTIAELKHFSTIYEEFEWQPTNCSHAIYTGASSGDGIGIGVILKTEKVYTYDGQKNRQSQNEMLHADYST